MEPSTMNDTRGGITTASNCAWFSGGFAGAGKRETAKTETKSALTPIYTRNEHGIIVILEHKSGIRTGPSEEV